jgi:endoglucanase Acf2
MKLARGAVFETWGTFTGVLPALPDAGSYDRAVLTRQVEEVAAEAEPPGKDTYWDGKYLGRLAAALPIAEQLRSPAAATIEERLKRRLEDWLGAEEGGRLGEGGRLKETNTFYLNRRWGTLIGYPASYGSDHELSDHHFHYGYFLRAAAEVARRDPAWAARWKPMVDLLARDIASPARDDPNFPFLRVFDPYAGHSWASGTAKFGSGNNHESSSEAMAAWTGLILWGQATGDTALRDTGVYLYTTEMEGINNYWFDVDARNRPREYEPSVITMVWGGKGVNETWFSKNPEAVHGINWLPFHGGSLYLGRHPEYLRRNYDALVRENGGADWDQWADIVWMARALSDPDDAWAQLEASRGTFKAEDGNSRANLVHWVGNLRELGQVDPAVTADHPLYAVFHKGAARTYVAYNTSDAPLNVAFSDGTTLAAPTRGWHTLRQTKPNP